MLKPRGVGTDLLQVTPRKGTEARYYFRPIGPGKAGSGVSGPKKSMGRGDQTPLTFTDSS
jgi:hypothetical protein